MSFNNKPNHYSIILKIALLGLLFSFPSLHNFDLEKKEIRKYSKVETQSENLVSKNQNENKLTKRLPLLDHIITAFDVNSYIFTEKFNKTSPTQNIAKTARYIQTSLARAPPAHI